MGQLLGLVLDGVFVLGQAATGAASATSLGRVADPPGCDRLGCSGEAVHQPTDLDDAVLPGVLGGGDPEALPRSWLDALPKPALAIWVPMVFHAYFLTAGVISGVIFLPPVLLVVSLVMALAAAWVHWKGRPLLQSAQVAQHRTRAASGSAFSMTRKAVVDSLDRLWGRGACPRAVGWKNEGFMSGLSLAAGTNV